MKKEGFYSERVKPVIVMAVITIICISLVAVLHLSTEDLVIANEGLVLKKAVLFAGGVEIPPTNQEINELYDSLVTERDGWYEISNDSGRTKAYAFIQAGPGLWGEIEAVTAFTPDFSTFAGVDFIKQNETPGLGARITELWFREQLRGRTYPLSMNPEGTESPGAGEIDAITGATRTSEYVLSLFNKAGQRAEQLKGEIQ